MAFPGLPAVDFDSAGPAEYYLNYPNGRIVSAFFLGCVFMNGLQYMTSSLFFKDLLARTRHFFHLCRRTMFPRKASLELPTTQTEKVGLEDEQETEALRQYNDHTALIFTLNLCFMLAGLAQFISLLAFANQASWGTGCAFVVAWGGMASQLGRLLGVMILTIELSRIGVKRRELISIAVSAFVGLVFVFATNATNNGTTSLAQSVGEVFCYRSRYLPTTLTASIIRLLLEVYLVVRLVILSRSRRRWLSDRSVKAVTIVRAASLFILELMTVVPDSILTNVVADFLPFCFGTFMVLAAFNWKWTTVLPSGQSHIQSLVFVSTKTADPLLMPTPFTLHFPRQYRTSTHSWCSHSQHPVPSTARSPSRSTTSSAHASQYHGSAVSAEHAVLETATTAWRRSVRQVSFPPELKPSVVLPEHPHSAPAQLIGFAAQPRFPRRILSSQLKLAAQLEEEEASSRASQAESTGPVVPHLATRQVGSVFVVEDESENSHETELSPTSAVFGSDIVRVTPGRRRADTAATHTSPAPTQTSFAFSPRSSARSYRFSYDSSIATHSTYSSHDDAPRTAQAQTPRSSRRSRAFLSPSDPLPNPWRSTLRSLSSLRRGSRSDAPLPAVPEAPPIPSVGWLHRAPHGKRNTFGQRRSGSTRASTHSLFRAPEPVPPLPPLLIPALTLPTPTLSGLTPPAPPTAPLVPRKRERLPMLTIPAAPAVHVSPATPPPPAPVAPVASRPRQGSFDRPGVGVAGPRPPPSALLAGGSASGWPAAAAPAARPTHVRRASSPSAYSQDSAGTAEQRRPSV